MMARYLFPSGGGGGYAAPGLSPMMSGFGYT
jgi:hypothetical protein